MGETLGLLQKGQIPHPFLSWVAISFPRGVVGQRGRIDIPCVIEYSSRSVLGHHPLPLSNESSDVGSVLERNEKKR